MVQDALGSTIRPTRSRMQARTSYGCNRSRIRMRTFLDLSDKDLSIDFKGHYSTGLVGPVRIVDNGDNPLLNKDYRDNLPYRLSKRLTPMLSLGISASEHCSICSKYVEYVLDNDVIIAQSECPYPDGYPPFTVDLNVPSGKIVFANDLRALTTLNDRDYDVNSTSEMGRLTKDYASNDAMVHVFVGNSMPGVYRKSDGSVTVENGGYDADADYEPLPVEGLELGSICTDLWWFSAMDADVFNQRCKEFNLDPEVFAPGWTELIVVDVAPGIWRWSVDYMQDTHDPNGVTYAHGQHFEIPSKTNST